MYWGPRFFYERYKLPLSITENGLATRDQVFLDGKVHDPQRIDYMHRVPARAARARSSDGVPVTGYYAWSLLDNFEWADGYKQRFGLVYVDYQNQKRVPKDSFDWYKKVIASNGRSLLRARPAAGRPRSRPGRVQSTASWTPPARESDGLGGSASRGGLRQFGGTAARRRAGGRLRGGRVRAPMRQPVGHRVGRASAGRQLDPAARRTQSAAGSRSPRTRRAR